MGKLIASAPNKEDFVNCINKFYYSTNYIITDDNKVYNTKTEKYLDDVVIKVSKSRWRFEFKTPWMWNFMQINLIETR